VTPSASSRFNASVISDWGSTAAERAQALPGDELLPEADGILHRAVDVAAAADLVFRWLCQMRVAPYSYDLIDNLGRRSPQELTPGLERLERGQRIAVVFRVEDFEIGRYLVMRHRGPVFGTVVCAYVVEPRGPAAARLLVRLRVDRPPGLVRGMAHRLLPLGDLVMMRRQLLNFKGLAERNAVP
jgi:hypothetical protein